MATHLLNCCWLETRCLICRVSFPTESGGWTCTGMKITSWNHRPYMATGYCLSWWSLCGGMGRIWTWCGTSDTSKDDVDRWGVCWYPVRTPTPIYVHYASDRLEKHQQDNSTPHTSRFATELFQEYSSHFRHFHWPPKIPFMNEIKHICDAFQRAVQKRYPPPSFLMDLWPSLEDSSSELLPGYLQILVETMPRHVAALLYVRDGLHDVRQV